MRISDWSSDVCSSDLIILKTQASGATVRLADVAKVELGAQSYNVLSRIDGHPGAGLAVSLAPGADALTTAEIVKHAITERAKSFPAGFEIAFPFDQTDFIKLSIEEVVKTLFEAIIDRKSTRLNSSH